MAISNNVSIAINQGGGGQVGGSQCGQGCKSKNGPEKPDRNPFLDFLTAPLQAAGKMGGNQNDREYAQYSHANSIGNALKGF
ncbi:hypothetical protein ABS71_02890 [bacterium SCN 62-11]|nr:MAG: hypothetical protein ABS71_02890 [bacterium SCN 62-11]